MPSLGAPPIVTAPSVPMIHVAPLLWRHDPASHASVTWLGDDGTAGVETTGGTAAGVETTGVDTTGVETAGVETAGVETDVVETVDVDPPSRCVDTTADVDSTGAGDGVPLYTKYPIAAATASNTTTIATVLAPIPEFHSGTHTCEVTLGRRALRIPAGRSHTRTMFNALRVLPKDHGRTDAALRSLKAGSKADRKAARDAAATEKLIEGIMHDSALIEKDGLGVPALFYVPVSGMNVATARVKLETFVQDINRRVAVFETGDGDYVSVASRRFNELSDPKRKAAVAAHFVEGDAIEAEIDDKTHYGLFKVGVRCISQRALDDLTHALLAWRADAVKRVRVKWIHDDLPQLNPSAAWHLRDSLVKMIDARGWCHTDIFTFFPADSLTEMKTIGGVVEDHADDVDLMVELHTVAKRAIRKAARK